jgi:acyl-CoA thioester hydrolase
VTDPDTIAHQYPEGGGSFLDGHQHALVIRVYYEDTDAEGVVYYANYLRYAERARTALLRWGGWENARLAAGDYPGMEKGVSFVMRHLSMDYRRAAMLDDLLIMRSRVLAIGGATMELQQTLSRGNDVLVEATARLGCIAAETLRPARIPQALRDYMQGFVSDNDERK